MQKLFKQRVINQDDSNNNLFAFLALASLVAMCFFPEISLAANDLESLSTKVGTTTGKVVKMAVGAAAGIGSVMGVLSGNWKLVLSIVGCAAVVGVGKAFIDNGMVLAV